MNNELRKEIEKMIDENTRKYDSFTAKKVTDTPTDSLDIVNRKYVNLNGTSANRPTASVIGQTYFDTSLGNGKLIIWNGTGFVDTQGNFV